MLLPCQSRSVHLPLLPARCTLLDIDSGSQALTFVLNGIAVLLCVWLKGRNYEHKKKVQWWQQQHGRAFAGAAARARMLFNLVEPLTARGRTLARRPCPPSLLFFLPFSLLVSTPPLWGASASPALRLLCVGLSNTESWP